MDTTNSTLGSASTGKATGTALAAFRILFRPVARILLRAGVNWREVAEVGKATYVEVATQEFGLRGRPANMSKVAILTGFTRREVRRLRDLLAIEKPETFTRMNYATRVLSGWWQDTDFLGADDQPLRLPPKGGSVSFETLCDRYSGDVAATAMLKELKRVGAVAEDAEGCLEARMRYYMPVPMDAEQMLRSGSVLEDLGNTVAYNLERRDRDLPRFERRATNTNMSAADRDSFKQFLDEEGQAFLERVDDWLTAHEREEGDGEDSLRLGLGAYWIEQTDLR